MNNAPKLTTNYDKSKSIIRALVGKRLSSCEFAFCLYLIDQQYGYSADKGTDGDSSGYGHISKFINQNPRNIKRAVKSLVGKNIIIKELSATKYGNRYKFNENLVQWTGKVEKTSVNLTTGVNLDTSGENVTGGSGQNVTRDSGENVTGVVAKMSPNNKVSTVNDLSVNNQTVDDSTAITEFRNTPLKENKQGNEQGNATRDVRKAWGNEEDALWDAGGGNPTSGKTATKGKAKKGKATATKKAIAPPTKESVKPVFFSFKENSRWEGVDFENEYAKFCEYYFDGQLKLKNAKLASHNWLDKALDRQSNRNNGFNPSRNDADAEEKARKTAEEFEKQEAVS